MLRLESVHLVGCGTLGTHTIANLLGCVDIEILHLYDKDIVEARNIGHRLRLKQSIGKEKTQALKQDIILNFSGRINPHNINVRTGDIIKWDKPKNPLSIEGLVIDCLDNTEARSFVTKMIKPEHLIHLGFSPDMTGEVHWGEGYKVPQGEHKQDPCDRPEFYAFASMLSSIAVLSIINWLETGEKDNYLVSKCITKKL